MLTGIFAKQCSVLLLQASIISASKVRVVVQTTVFLSVTTLARVCSNMHPEKMNRYMANASVSTQIFKWWKAGARFNF